MAKITYYEDRKVTATLVSMKFRTDGVLKSFTVRKDDGTVEEVRRDFNAGGFLEDVVIHLEE